MSDLAPEDALNGPPVDTPPISRPTNVNPVT
jgi:hypothetical protein